MTTYYNPNANVVNFAINRPVRRQIILSPEPAPGAPHPADAKYLVEIDDVLAKPYLEMHLIAVADAATIARLTPTASGALPPPPVVEAPVRPPPPAPNAWAESYPPPVLGRDTRERHDVLSEAEYEKKEYVAPADPGVHSNDVPRYRDSTPAPTVVIPEDHLVEPPSIDQVQETMNPPDAPHPQAAPVVAELPPVSTPPTDLPAPATPRSTEPSKAAQLASLRAQLLNDAMNAPDVLPERDPRAKPGRKLRYRA